MHLCKEHALQFVSSTCMRRCQFVFLGERGVLLNTGSVLAVCMTTCCEKSIGGSESQVLIRLLLRLPWVCSVNREVSIGGSEGIPKIY